MRRLVLLACLVPGVALAQPGPPPAPPAPGDPAAPADPNALPPEAAPAPAPAPAPQPPPPPPPAGGYYQPVQPIYGPPPAQSQSLHRSMTFELNLGLGWIHLSTEEGSDTSDLGVGGLSIGVGGWINEKLALTGRIAGVTLSENGNQLSNVFFGPSLQYWVDNHFWLGGGLGVGILAAGGDNSSDDSLTGFGIDLRVGYTFNEGTENTFNASFELNPGFFSENSSSATLTGIGILLGYQHL